MTKIQTTLKSFSIKPKGETGDFMVGLTFESQEGPGMLEDLIKLLGPLNKQEVIIKIEPVQLRIYTGTGEVK
jgi:hypothetical protein